MYELRLSYKEGGDISSCVSRRAYWSAGVQDIDKRRHLLRLWVAPSNDRPLPEEYAEMWGSTEPGRRGGIRIGTQLTVPLEAE
jgi:hypothetical protein